MKFERITLSEELKIAYIKESDNRGLHRRQITPGSDISNEPPEVKTACKKAWTLKVKKAYKAHLAKAV